MPIKRKRSLSNIVDEYFESIEEMMEQMRTMLSEKPSWNQKTCTIEPLRDITLTPTEVIVTVDLPYAEEKTVKIKPLEKNVLEIRAKMKKKVKFNELGITHRKGEFKEFHCQTRIPVPVHTEKMEILFKKGILKICLPRKEEFTIPIE